jgi:hypothetical protein
VCACTFSPNGLNQADFHDFASGPKQVAALIRANRRTSSEEAKRTTCLVATVVLRAFPVAFLGQVAVPTDNQKSAGGGEKSI